MFLMKKIVAPFFLPLPFSLIILFFGLSLLWFTKKKKAGRLIITFGVVLLTFLSHNTSSIILAPLEKQYPQYSSSQNNGETPKYVVVLAGGLKPAPNIPLTAQLSRPTLVRLVEGIRIYNENPGSKLLVSGGGGSGFITEARLMERLAASVGVKKNDIITEGMSRDTKDQAKLIKKIVKNAPFILVTSASHMPRSMALFKKQGMNPIPGPTGHLVRRIEGEGLGPNAFFPTSSKLQKSERAVYEYLGMAWAKIRGQI